MSANAFTLLDDGRDTTIDATVAGTEVHLSSTALANSTGWQLKPEGFCRGATCIPVRDRHTLERGGALDLAGVARVLDRPLALDLDGRAAWLGVGAADRGAQLASLEAPEFTLPDLDGRPRSLREFRGKKVFLLAFSSW